MSFRFTFTLSQHLVYFTVLSPEFFVVSISRSGIIGLNRTTSVQFAWRHDTEMSPLNALYRENYEVPSLKIYGQEKLNACIVYGE